MYNYKKLLFAVTLSVAALGSNSASAVKYSDLTLKQRECVNLIVDEVVGMHSNLSSMWWGIFGCFTGVDSSFRDTIEKKILWAEQPLGGCYKNEILVLTGEQKKFMLDTAKKLINLSESVHEWEKQTDESTKQLKGKEIADKFLRRLGDILGFENNEEYSNFGNREVNIALVRDRVADLLF